MSLVATAGGSSSNSYVTRAEASSYLGDRLYAAAWEDADPQDQDKALVTACRRLEQEEYLGYRATNEQALKWPRAGTCDADGTYYATDSVPAPVKHAQVELALLLLETDALKQSRLSNFEQLEIGPLKLKPKQPQSSGALPAQVVRLLAGLLATAPGTIRMVRG
jgi:hypothetical protein